MLPHPRATNGRALDYNIQMPTSSPNTQLRNIPSVDEVLRSDTGRKISKSSGEKVATDLTRRFLDELRTDVTAGNAVGAGKTEFLKRVLMRMKQEWEAERRSGTRRVINATGVVIHTNLGRAPLSTDARKAVADASGYCALEYDVVTGKRGKRGRRAESLLVEMTGAEDVLIVNNCAAAAFFVLTVFAADGEVIVSRGEMVEIGGDFRVPDVLAQSGATLREVGTTNRTKLADYQKAINEETRVILRVHPSNYRIVGFTTMPTLAELSALSHDRNVLFYEDIGSGALIDLTEFGLKDEPIVRDSIAAGVDVVTFSGDKLLGGPQSGIIAGRAKVIERLRKHPLYRALRVGKTVYAALEATLDAYRRSAYDEIPVLRMLRMTKEEIGERAEKFVAESQISDLRFEIIDGHSAIGGGAAPNVQLETRLIAISHARMSASKLEFKLRQNDVPIVTRIVDDHVVFDLRTVSEEDEVILIDALSTIR